MTLKTWQNHSGLFWGVSLVLKILNLRVLALLHNKRWKECAGHEHTGFTDEILHNRQGKWAVLRSKKGKDMVVVPETPGRNAAAHFSLSWLGWNTDLQNINILNVIMSYQVWDNWLDRQQKTKQNKINISSRREET